MRKKKIREEINALKRLALSCREDQIAQSSIAGQINALEWAINFR